MSGAQTKGELLVEDKVYLDFQSLTAVFSVTPLLICLTD